MAGRAYALADDVTKLSAAQESESPKAALWRRVDELIDRAPSLSDLRAHRLHLLAAQYWRERGRPIPADLLEEERQAAFMALASIAVLRRIAEASDTPVLVFKGAEMAPRYPGGSGRPFSDIDVLTPHAEELQRALIGAGFVGAGLEGPRFYDELHHLQPLVHEAMPVVVEVHRRPAWPEWLPEPDPSFWFDDSVPSSAGVARILAPSAARHALLIACHGWDFNPLGRAGDLLDIQVLMSEVGRDRIDAEAEAAGIERLWQATRDASDALFGAHGYGKLPAGGRHLKSARDSTVLEQHFRRVMSPFWALPVSRAARASSVAFGRSMLPARGETWPSKFMRVRRAFKNAMQAASTHTEELGDAGRHPPRRKRY